MVVATSGGQRSRRGYDRLAGWYRCLETLAFGAELQRARVALLPRLAGCRRILVLGDGDGRLLETLLMRHDDCRVTSVEQSRRMVEMQRRRVTDANAMERVKWVRSDALRFVPGRNRFDAVVTAFFLDCFTPDSLAQLMPRLCDALTPHGLWYFVDFQRPRDGYARLRARCILYGLHRFFGWQTGLANRQLVDMPAWFTRHRLQLVERVDRNCGLLTSRIYQASAPLPELPSRFPEAC